MVSKARREPGSLSRFGCARRVAIALALIFSAASGAEAQVGYFEPDTLTRTGYELRVTAAYHDVTRSDFTRPIFLIAQPLARLRVQQFALQADVRLRVTSALALQLVVPVLFRALSARSYGLQVSREQSLPGRGFSISGSGLGDPRLGASYTFLRLQPWTAYAELGATFPVDDNPGSAVLPERVPLGTGQHVFVAGVGGGFALPPVRVHAGYRFGYSPGEHATYLIRRASTQVYTSGAFAPHLAQSALLSVEVGSQPVFRAALGWTARQWPELIAPTGHVRLLRESWSHALDVAAAVRVRIAPGHQLELRGELPIVPISDLDPFFPIVVPARGVSLLWVAGG